MNRRNFLSSLAAGTMLGAIQTHGLALSKSAGESVKKAFANSLRKHPWLVGFRSASDLSFASRAKVSGKWPRELNGVLYRNGPALFEFEDFRQHHWFDGDGMLQAFRISSSGVWHNAKIIQTHKFKAEKAAGRALYPGFGSKPPDSLPVVHPDQINTGNISVLFHHRKLLALWEGGSAWKIDPESLETEGLYEFSSNTAGVPFSAHPRVEPDGTLWNFGYFSNASLIVLWHIDRHGALKNIGKVKVDPIGMPHDFIVTSRHIVILVPPLNYQPGNQETFLDSHRWQPELPTRVLVVDKDDFSNYHWLELPSQWVFHFGNGWEDKAGTIRFDGARYDHPGIMLTSFRDIMRGQYTPWTPSRHYLYRIDTKSWTISESPIMLTGIQSEFPAIDPRVSTRRHGRLVALCVDDQSRPVHGWLNSVCSFSLESGKLERYCYPDSQIPEEHLFVGKPGSEPESEGWVIGTALDWQRDATIVNLFNIEAINDGPVATAVLPYALPLGLHGKFVST